MDPRQRRILTVVIIFVLAAWLIAPMLFSVRGPAVAVSKAPLIFDAEQAHRTIRQFVEQFPVRTLGTLESRQSTGFLQDRLQTLGYEISYSHFDARIARRKQVGRNVLGFRKGENPEILAFVAHLDTARTTVQGAMDNGSGVGVLIELARVLSAVRTNRSILVIFSDGNEWGSIGAADLAANYPQRDRIVAVLSLDNVSTGDLEALCLQEDGLAGGYTPPWLRQLATEAAGTQGAPVRGASAFSEHLERSLNLAYSDQGPFLHAGIPAVNLGSISWDKERAEKIYHSAEDKIENLKITSVRKYGRAAERIARTLDELPAIPEQSQGYFRLWGDRYTRPGVMQVLHAITFLPLPFVLWFLLRNHRRRLTATMIGRELLSLMGTVIPFLLMYFAIGLFRALRQIPLYTLYPATKDPALMNPPWTVLGIILGTGVAAAVVAFIVIGYSLRSFPKPDFYAAKQILLSLLLIGIVLGLWYNSYWAVTFLLAPAWIWALAGAGRDLRGRAINTILIAAAAVPYVALSIAYASRLQLGWNLVWYQVLAISNGLFAIPAFLLGVFIAALGIRFLVIQSHPASGATG